MIFSPNFMQIACYMRKSAKNRHWITLKKVSSRTLINPNYPKPSPRYLNSELAKIRSIKERSKKMTKSSDRWIISTYSCFL